MTTHTFLPEGDAGIRTVWVTRHARTCHNDAGQVTGWADGQVTPTGRRDIETVRPWWEQQQITRVVSSPLGRATRTATLLFGRVDEIDAAWAEQAAPAIEGYDIGRAVRQWPELCHPNGWPRRDAPLHPGVEHFDTITGRAVAALSRCASSVETGAAVAVVTHGAVLVALLAAAGDRCSEVANLAVCELRVDPTCGWDLVAVHHPLDV